MTWETEYGQRQWQKLTATTYSPHPTIKADASESRICFGLSWYRDEATADEVGKWVRKKGFTYNGGWMHGCPCGRDSSFDFDGADGLRYYAVTH